MSFASDELRRQIAFFDARDPGRKLTSAHEYRFPERVTNLAPAITDVAERHFADMGIGWHTHSNHALSSQACCVNFLMPLAADPDRLSLLIGTALGISQPRMQPVETDASGRDWYVGFEWTGVGNYLNEQIGSRPVSRGSNSTSTDAFVRFTHAGIQHALLIEWKYTESYGPALRDKRRLDGSGGNQTRNNRYGQIAFHPNGPIRDDLGLTLPDFFWEPFYQLLRQQMLAFQMKKHGEADIVRVLHLSPRGNKTLHRVTAPKLAPFGTDVFAAFQQVLVEPDMFITRHIEDVFGPLLAAAAPDDTWAHYLKSRYLFLSDPA